MGSGQGLGAVAQPGALRGVPAEPLSAGDFDVIVVGGGVAGCAATLSENDIRTHVVFPDAVVQNDGAFCTSTSA